MLVELDSILICPVCHQGLPLKTIRVDGQGTCPGCQRVYLYQQGIFNLIPDTVPDVDVQQKWSLWNKLQDNGELSYSLRPEQNLSLGPRTDARAFKDFCQLAGLVLDVGCGPQVIPSYG